MGFSLDVNIPVMTVFIQGLLSFFSPCILPLIPLYMGYLSGGTMKRDTDGKITYKRSIVMINTFFFVLGVSVTFLVLGLGVSALGTFLHKYQIWFTRIGSVLIIFLGLYQLGVFGSNKLLGNTHKLPFRLEKLAMSPITAFLMGFTFSFAWTPCVGPALTSVLLMAASAEKKMMGFLLIGVYTIGFILPFLIVGLFTTSVIGFFKKHMKIVRYTVRIGGILMILMGILMFTGKMNAITGYLSDASISTEDFNDDDTEEDNIQEDVTGEDNKDKDVEEDTERKETVPAPDFTLIDQYGNTHTLSEYKGKTVFLNFWATWCGPCRNEMPDIQKLYEEYSREGEEALIILGVATPGIGGEGTVEEITQFMKENGYTYPVLMDTTGEIAYGTWGVSSFPTTYMINRDGNVEGYISGQLSEDIMRNIIKQTMEGDTN